MPRPKITDKSVLAQHLKQGYQSIRQSDVKLGSLSATYHKIAQQMKNHVSGDTLGRWTNPSQFSDTIDEEVLLRITWIVLTQGKDDLGVEWFLGLLRATSLPVPEATDRGGIQVYIKRGALAQGAEPAEIEAVMQRLLGKDREADQPPGVTSDIISDAPAVSEPLPVQGPETEPRQELWFTTKQAMFIGALVVIVLTFLVIFYQSRSRSMPEETIRLDTWEGSNDRAVGPISGRKTLKVGEDYHVTIVGTWSAWPMSWWVARCTEAGEPEPQESSEGVGNGMVGIDAAFIFAAPKQASICYSVERLPVSAAVQYPLEVSLDNGVTWVKMTPHNPNYNPNHSYTYTLVGQGFPAQFRLIDLSTTDDNYGVLTIKITEQPRTAQ